MLKNLPESKWKKYKLILQSALWQLAEGEGKDSHERRADVYAFTRESQKELCGLFDGCRRRTAVMQRAMMYSEQRVDVDEVNSLFEDTRSTIRMIVG